jgi:N-methylhydantoinase B/oxoprolinase/acetone carboxylase alpha subunit
VWEARKRTMKPEDVVVLETPGGGGYGPAPAKAAE